MIIGTTTHEGSPLARLSDRRGVIAALAIDQRGTLQRSLAHAKDISLAAAAEDMSIFKACVARVLGSQATAVLLDVDYGMDAIRAHDRARGLLLAYEKWGYDEQRPGRLQQTLDGWTVAQLRDVGADWIKILLWYTPFEREEINDQKRAWIRRIGEECQAAGVAFCLEPLAYDPAGDAGNPLAFARQKPAAVAGYMREFSRPEYHVGLLKVEIPVDMTRVEGARAHRDGPAAYTRDEALDAFRGAADATHLPFVYLSAGVDKDVFLESLAFAAEAGVAFNGVLCGRAMWQDGIPAYARGGEAGLEDWLADTGMANVRALNDLLQQTATPLRDIGAAPG